MRMQSERRIEGEKNVMKKEGKREREKVRN